MNRWWVAVVLILANVTAQGASVCTTRANGPVFGVYEPLTSTDTLATGAVILECRWLSGGADRIAFTVRLNSGVSGSFANRQLRSGTQWLLYNLYADPGYVRIWGDGTAGTATVSDGFTVSRGQPLRVFSAPLYARLPTAQFVDPGLYADTIAVTIEY